MNEPAFGQHGYPPKNAAGDDVQLGEQARRLNVVLAVMLVTAAVLLIWLLWRFDPARVRLPLCGLHMLTGWHCPGCGTLRATHELLHGRLSSAAHDNALWLLSLPLAAYVCVSELRVCFGRRPLPGDLACKRWFWIAVATVAVIFFLLRNLPWPPFSILAPPQ